MITNRGKYRILQATARAASFPSSFYVALITAASVPSTDTKLMSELTEITAGNGYTSGGIQVTRDAVGFPALTEDDVNNLASTEVKDLTWTATGGPLPSAGGNIAYAVLTDDDGTLANREVWAFAEVTVGSLSVGQTLTLEDWVLQLLEQAGDMTDPNAIHDNVAAEIAAITSKATPISADLLLIEDSAASNAKKRITVGSLPGEANTASNIGTGGVGVFDGKVGVDLQFKKVNAGSSKITVTDDVPNNEVDVDLGTVNLADLNDVSAATTTANQVLATPNGAPGSYSGRALVAADIPNVPGKDTDAIHDNVAAEISAVTEKVAPVSADLILIEDSAAANAKKRVQLGNLPDIPGIDTDAIHDNVAGEINAITEKVAPISADLLVIEDSADSNNKKKVQIGNLPGGAGGTTIPGTFEARLTLTTGTPVTTSDVTAATTVYLTPYKGELIALYNGASWDYFNLNADISVAVPATTDTNYDVFVYDSGGLTLEAVAWSSATARATALVKQDGVYVKSGATGRRYVGSFRTTGVSGQTEDSTAKRYLWNYYNRVMRPMSVVDTTDSWTYATATWRAGNNSSTNRVEFVIGVDEIPVLAFLGVNTMMDQGVGGTVGIGLDTTSANSAEILFRVQAASGFQNDYCPTFARYRGHTGIGYHYLQWVEYALAGTMNFYGDGGTVVQSGLEAELWG